jgi:transposase-like protein
MGAIFIPDRAVDSAGHTIDFLLIAGRDTKPAKRCARKVLRAHYTVTPRVITVDQTGRLPRVVRKNWIVPFFHMISRPTEGVPQNLLHISLLQ